MHAENIFFITMQGANASFVGKAARSANASRISSAKRLIVRAEQTSLAKVRFPLLSSS